jgi:hypothetical protein
VVIAVISIVVTFTSCASLEVERWWRGWGYRQMWPAVVLSRIRTDACLDADQL